MELDASKYAWAISSSSECGKSSGETKPVPHIRRTNNIELWWWAVPNRSKHSKVVHQRMWAIRAGKEKRMRKGGPGRSSTKLCFLSAMLSWNTIGTRFFQLGAHVSATTSLSWSRVRTMLKACACLRQIIALWIAVLPSHFVKNWIVNDRKRSHIICPNLAASCYIFFTLHFCFLASFM